MARLAAPNLTAGRAPRPLTDDEWELSVRHGLGPGGRPLYIMPSSEYAYLSDQDLADIVAFARALLPVRDELPPRRMGPLGRTLLLLGQVPDQHTLIPADARHLTPVKEATIEFGFYLARLCVGCHGADLEGVVTGQPGAPPAPSLTPAGPLGSWSLEDFVTAMRTGRTPDGRELDDAFMPWTSVGRSTDEELEAIWLYLGSL